MLEFVRHGFDDAEEFSIVVKKKLLFDFMMISKYERNTDFMIFWQPLEDLAILIMKRNKCEEGIDGFGFEFVLMIS